MNEHPSNTTICDGCKGFAEPPLARVFGLNEEPLPYVLCQDCLNVLTGFQKDQPSVTDEFGE